MKKLKILLIGLSMFSLAIFVYAGTDVQTFTVGGNQVFNITNTGVVTQTGALEFGDSNASPSLPTASTAADFGVKVPVQNGGGTTIAKGSVIIASASASGIAIVSSISALASIDVLGVADADILSFANGFMTISGYALMLTTGAVANGDILISTDGTNGSGAAGYGGVDSTPTVGAAIAKAIGPGTTSGGLTPVLLMLH